MKIRFHALSSTAGHNCNYYKWFTKLEIFHTIRSLLSYHYLRPRILQMTFDIFYIHFSNCFKIMTFNTFSINAFLIYTLYWIHEGDRAGKTGGGAGSPLFCQAKFYLVPDFKMSNDVLNFEIIHSIYQIMVVLAVVCSIPKLKNTIEYPFI